MTDYKAISEELFKAHDIIKERGWTNGVMLNQETGQVCAVGAIGLAAGMDEGALGFIDEDDADTVASVSRSMSWLAKFLKETYGDNPIVIRYSNIDEGALIMEFNDSSNERDVRDLLLLTGTSAKDKANNAELS